MKKALFIFMLLLSTLFMNAQEKIGVYHSSYFDVDQDVSASYNSRNVLSMYIQVMGEHSKDMVNLSFDGDEITEFINALKQTKEKFLEWKAIAEQNNVKDMMKEFDIKFPRTTVAWYGSQWWFCFSHKLTPKFLVSETGKCIFLMSSKVHSSRNEYIDMTYYFALTEASDFDELIEAMDPVKAEAHFNKKQDVQDLFK